MQKCILFFAAMMFFAAGTSWAQQQCQTNTIAATTSHLVSKAKTDGTVADSKTKLMWKRCPEGYNYASTNNICSKSGTIAYTWTNALNRPATVNATGFPNAAGLPNYKNWRLPNIKELHSIIEEQCWNAAVNETVFPRTDEVDFLWSNSPSATAVAANSSWCMDLMYGEMMAGPRSDTYGVRLVRDCGPGECD